MMGREDYKEFGEKCGIPIKTAKFSDSDGTFNSDNEYLTIINTAAVKRMDLWEYYDSRQNILDIERNTLFLLSEELKRFKKEKGLKDFNDLLLDFIAKEKTNSFKVLFMFCNIFSFLIRLITTSIVSWNGTSLFVRTSCSWNNFMRLERWGLEL